MNWILYLIIFGNASFFYYNYFLYLKNVKTRSLIDNEIIKKYEFSIQLLNNLSRVSNNVLLNQQQLNKYISDEIVKNNHQDINNRLILKEVKVTNDVLNVQKEMLSNLIDSLKIIKNEKNSKSEQVLKLLTIISHQLERNAE